MKEENYKCNHNPNDIDNSLRMLKNVEMVFPRKYYFQCEECKRFFMFTKGKNKAFVECED